MPEPSFLPTEVLESIRAHLRDAVETARETFLSADEDEDTMTGHLGAHIQRRPISVLVDAPQGGGVWTWSIKYRKLRGRGPGASEAITGADGIFELIVDSGGLESTRKSALFQAKMFGAGGADLLEQAVKLTTWREAAFVIDYAPEAFTVATLDDVIAGKGWMGSIAHKMTLADFLVGEFISCKIGDRDLQYDAIKKILYWRDIAGDRVAVRFRIKHKFHVTVTTPWYRDRQWPHVDKIITSEEVHRHRMWARPEDILGLNASHTQKELSSARRKVAQLLHPDRFGSVDDQLRAMINQRMAEANAAYDELSGKSPKRRR